MIKKLIGPLQKILLQKKLCPGCTRSLEKAKLIESKSNEIDVVACECSRIFIYNRDLDTYRRALPEEL